MADLRAVGDWLDSQDRLETLLVALTDVLDSFDRLLAAPEGADAPVPDSVRLIARQVESAVRAAGLEPIGEVGELAEPHTHRVVEVRSDGDVVVAVLRRGYRYAGRVVRTAQVIVGSSVDEVTE
jgi:molecular chaperone GrpE